MSDIEALYRRIDNELAAGYRLHLHDTYVSVAKDGTYYRRHQKHILIKSWRIASLEEWVQVRQEIHTTKGGSDV